MFGWQGLLAAIHDVGRDATTGGYRRYAWTREDAELREWFAAECGRRGLDLTEDRMGNQWAWWGDPDTQPGQGIVTGSHLDSVPDGGAFDGSLGVVSALAAVDELRARGYQPRRPLGLVRFVDEEGARFGVACAGSRVITGALDPDRARTLTDAGGVTMAEAMAEAGRPTETIGADPGTLARVGVFVELHIEQGRGLAGLDRSLAVGSDIWPHGRWRVEFTGRADHAGTTRLDDRDDPMIGFAEMVLAARSAARTHGCLATVGKVAVRPNGVNAIPGRVTGWLDARGPETDPVRATVAAVSEAATRSGATVHPESWTDRTSFDRSLADRLSRRLGHAPLLGTGAGHDAGILANSGISTAMLYVRNPTGVSHSPREWADPRDCQAGVLALTDVLADLASED